MDCEKLSEERRKELQELFQMKVERKGKGTGRKKKKNKNKLPYESDKENSVGQGLNLDTEVPTKKKQKKNEKCKVCGDKGHRKMDCEKLSEDRRKELQELFQMKVERKGKGTGRKKKKNKNKLPYESDKENS